MIKYSLVFLILIMAFSTCCVHNKKSFRKPVSSIQFQPKVKSLTHGQKLTIEVNSDPKDGKIDSVFLYIDNNMVFATKQNTFNYELNTGKTRTGRHSIQVVAKKTDGIIGKNFRSLLILSDIKPKKRAFKTLNTFNHSIENFTQGLEYHDGNILESTGENGHSGIFIYPLGSDDIIKSNSLEYKYFGEGITLLNNKIYQLTYKAQKGFVYNAETLEKINEFTYKSKEGWGLTNDGKNLIMSDGTSILTWLNPETFEIIKTIDVCDNLHQVTRLNELEYINGDIYSNIWTTEQIVRIDSETGKVLEYIDLKGILPAVLSDNNRRDVLNGIAWKKDSNTLLVTGKLWPKMFEIEL